MADLEQEKWLKGFSWVGFFFPWIYLFRARQYLLAVIVLIIPSIVWYFLTDILWSVLAIIVAVVIWIKWRQLAFSKTKKMFEDFKIWYKKACKVLFWIFIPLYSLILIGILAAALLPRLASVQVRANDVARQAQIEILSTALSYYYNDNETFPLTWGSIDTMAWIFSDYMDNIPADPNQDATLSWLISIAWTPWQYMYIPLNKSWTVYNWFVLLAKTETERWSNRIFDKTMPIENMKDVDSIKPCKTITQTTSVKNKNDGDCYYVNTWDLWFILPYKE